MGDVKMRGLVTLKEILENTRKEGYAVGSFNFNGYEDAQGIINGAAEKNSPVILMASMGACKYIGLHQTVGMIKGMAASVEIPVCLHLDHATDMDYIKEAIKAGFSSVMIDASAEDYEINIQKSKEIVEFAKDYHCSVEAELGKVGGKEENIVVSDEKATFTQPSDVPRFVEETGIDALAIAFGSVHGFYKSEPKLDFERLAEIAKITDCPLVLHGGTGIPVEDFKKCVVSGISKINVGTEFKKTFTDTIRKMCNDLPEKEVDPRKYMGPVKDACAEVVKGKIDVFGSANKA
ncbi:class II fructose-bisphosphate aldolase [Anaerotignum propionicum]|uniref:class II fructose-bisphosphate aldolase n=1 Tax=Anaerotignum propionicum TaxID=28446 RepID=UPI00289B2334|nr:class II fructose-bisphosphate aldolase [Anaerotignum propionicum]